MSTVKKIVTPNGWSKVSNGTKGSLFVQQGSRVALTQATTAPSSTKAPYDVALLDILDHHQSKVYFGLAADEGVYARALTDYDSVVADTVAI